MFGQFKKFFAPKAKVVEFAPGDPKLAADYQWVITAAKERFPKHDVQGLYFQENKAYGVQISNGKKKSLLQLHAQVLIDGKPQMSDLNSVKNRHEILAGAFNAIEKALAA